MPMKLTVYTSLTSILGAVFTNKCWRLLLQSNFFVVKFEIIAPLLDPVQLTVTKVSNSYTLSGNIMIQAADIINCKAASLPWPLETKCNNGSRHKTYCSLKGYGKGKTGELKDNHIPNIVGRSDQNPCNVPAKRPYLRQRKTWMGCYL